MPRTKFTDAEEKFIIENCGRLTDIKIAAILSRLGGRNINMRAVTHFRRLVLKMSKEKGDGQNWWLNKKEDSEKET